MSNGEFALRCNKLRKRIILGSISEKELIDSLDSLEREYPDSFTGEFHPDSEKLFNLKKYYKELKSKYDKESCSREFYVELFKIRNQCKKRSGKASVVAIVVLIIVILAIVGGIRTHSELEALRGGNIELLQINGDLSQKNAELTSELESSKQENSKKGNWFTRLFSKDKEE